MNAKAAKKLRRICRKSVEAGMADVAYNDTLRKQIVTGLRPSSVPGAAPIPVIEGRRTRTVVRETFRGMVQFGKKLLRTDADFRALVGAAR